MKNLIFIIILIIVAIASALFFAQNDGITTINYFGRTIDLKLNWVLIAMIMLGFLLGVLLTLSNLIGTRIKLLSANKRVKKLEKILKTHQTFAAREEK